MILYSMGHLLTNVYEGSLIFQRNCKYKPQVSQKWCLMTRKLIGTDTHREHLPDIHFGSTGFMHHHTSPEWQGFHLSTPEVSCYPRTCNSQHAVLFIMTYIHSMNRDAFTEAWMLWVGLISHKELTEMLTWAIRRILCYFVVVPFYLKKQMLEFFFIYFVLFMCFYY